MNSEIRTYIESCGTCTTYSTKQPAEPPVITEQPEQAWSKVATDLFSFGGKNFLATVDCYSNFIEVDYLQSTDSSTVIVKLKAHFARQGIPDVLMTDNGPQFSSTEFRRFVQSWGFRHQTSSPGYPQSNGSAEAAVKVAKSLMRKCLATKDDYFLALLNHRNTPSAGFNSSPSQRLLGRRSKTLLPITKNLLRPEVTNHSQEFQNKLFSRSNHLDKYASGRDLPPLQVGDNVRIQPIANGQRQWKEGTVMETLPNRSFIVASEDGSLLRRNRKHLRKTRESTHSQPENTYVRPEYIDSESRPENVDHQLDGNVPKEDASVTTTPAMSATDEGYRTRSGRMSRKPVRYGQDC